MQSKAKEREFLQGHLWEHWDKLETDQRKRLPPPAVEKPAPPAARLVDLDAPDRLNFGDISLLQAIQRRRSHRIFTADPLTLQELAFLLWATQGVRAVLNDRSVTLRTVPSGGARHPFETYLVVHRVTGLEPGLYRYLPLEHRLCFLYSDPDLPEKIKLACADFARDCAVVFIWTAIPYRTEWRYGPLSPKLIAQDSGHLCQNLYLACEAIGAGTCAVGAYHQAAMDDLLGVDGEEEFTVYSAPVGKVN